MKLKVLVENHTYIDQYFSGEPAVSFYLEDGDKRILFDVGYSDLIIKNASVMNIDLNRIDTIIFSHGHNDHTRVLAYLTEQYDLSGVEVIAHSDVFKRRVCKGQDIGSPILEENLKNLCQLHLVKEPLKVSPNLTFLGEIPTLCEFEPRRAVGKLEEGSAWKEDLILDDTALVYKNEQGLYIITGCSHSGICNIIEYAKRICKDDRIVAVIGGFHLFEVNDRVKAVVHYFKENQIQSLYPCHCVSFQVKAYIHQEIPICEVGVGLELEW